MVIENPRVDSGRLSPLVRFGENVQGTASCPLAVGSLRELEGTLNLLL